VLYLPASELLDRITITERIRDKKRCLTWLEIVPQQCRQAESS
jgi:hypothetical protein